VTESRPFMPKYTEVHFEECNSLLRCLDLARIEPVHGVEPWTPSCARRCMWVFRGQSCAGWPLKPRARRRVMCFSVPEDRRLVPIDKPTRDATCSSLRGVPLPPG